MTSPGSMCVCAAHICNMCYPKMAVVLSDCDSKL